MMIQPKISIVMPAWNAERYLTDALESVFNQTYPNFELLVCDGGSTDSTLEIFKGVSDDRLKIVSQSDKGLPDALNKGFSFASGDIYCWLNSDDVYLSADAIKSAVHEFVSEGSTDFLLGLCATLTEEGSVSRYLLPWVTRSPFAYQGHSNVFTGALFFRATTWRQFGGFDPQYGLAFEYQLLRFLFSSEAIGRVSSSVAYAGFRQRPDSLSGANADKMRAQLAAILGGKFNPSMNMREKIARVIGHMRDGQLQQFLTLSKMNKALPRPWRSVFY